MTDAEDNIRALRRRRLTMIVAVISIFIPPIAGLSTKIDRLKHEHARLVARSQNIQLAISAGWAEFRVNSEAIEEIFKSRNDADDLQNARLKRLMDRNKVLAKDGLVLADTGESTAEERLINTTLVLHLMHDLRRVVILFCGCEAAILIVYTVRIRWLKRRALGRAFHL